MHGVVSIGDGLMPAIPLGQLDMSNYYSHFLPSTSVRVYKEDMPSPSPSTSVRVYGEDVILMASTIVMLSG